MQHRKLDRLMTPVERIARVAAAGLTSATSSTTKPSGAKSYDNADGTRTIIGNVANGESNPSYTMATHVGDTTAPGTPTGVTASSKSGVVVVEWDGTLTGGIPDDFYAVRVYLDGSELGILTGAGSVSSASLEGGTTHSVTATAEDDACLPDGTPAHNVSAPTAAISVTVSEGVEDVAAEVEQVRQDVADFRDDVATTYATKVEREDGDDAVKTWVTTNYTNSNDLATTYATKTLVSQTKDAIELAASQTYETQTDAAATYATKAALTVGLDGIRTEVAEDYQPKGDYATTASMNSAIQQSASSIESSVEATYLKQSDASTTYATKTEVQQTASGLDTRITTATNTANSAKSAVDNLQVGGTNLASDAKLWYTRTASSEFTAQGITVKQLGDGLYSAIGTTTGNGDIWFQTTNIDAALSRYPGDYVMSAYVESGTWPSSNFRLQLAAYRLSNNTWNRNIRTANGSTSQAFTCTSDYPRHFGFYSNTSGVEVNITFRLKLERGNVPTDWSPAPEDMATEADLQAEVTERQTLIRQFSGGVLAGYVGNAIAALVNAAGSFDVVQTTWSNGVPTVTDTLARYAANLIRIGEETGQNVLITSAGQLFRKGVDNLMALVAGDTYTESFTLPLRVVPYDYYPTFTLQHAPSRIISAQVGSTDVTDGCLFVDGSTLTWTGKVPLGNSEPGLWGQTLTVTYAISPSLSLWDGLGNVVASFGARVTSLASGMTGSEPGAGEVSFFESISRLRAEHRPLYDSTGAFTHQSDKIALLIDTEDQRAGKSGSATSGVIARTQFDDSETLSEVTLDIQAFAPDGSNIPTYEEPFFGIRAIATDNQGGETQVVMAAHKLLAISSESGGNSTTMTMNQAIQALNCRSSGVVTMWAGTKVLTVSNVSTFVLLTKAQLQAIVGTSWTPTGSNCAVFVTNGDYGVTDAIMTASIDASSVVRVHLNKARNGPLRVNYLIIRFA